MATSSLSAIAENGTTIVDEGWRLLQTMPLGLLVIGQDGVARLVNAQAADFLGISAAQVLGRHWRLWLRLSDALTEEPVTELPRDGRAGDRPGAAALRYRVKRAGKPDRVVEI